MTDWSKAPQSKNVEDRRPQGLMRWLDKINAALGTGRHSNEFLNDQARSRMRIEQARLAPTMDLAERRIESARKVDPSIPYDVNLDNIVEQLIANAKADTTKPVVNFKRK